MTYIILFLINPNLNKASSKWFEKEMLIEWKASIAFNPRLAGQVDEVTGFKRKFEDWLGVQCGLSPLSK